MDLSISLALHAERQSRTAVNYFIEGDHNVFGCPYRHFLRVDVNEINRLFIRTILSSGLASARKGKRRQENNRQQPN